jgi:hypothetical protein
MIRLLLIDDDKPPLRAARRATSRTNGVSLTYAPESGKKGLELLRPNAVGRARVQAASTPSCST